MKETLRYLAGLAGPSGYGSNSTAEQVTEDCSLPSQLTAIITGLSLTMEKYKEIKLSSNASVSFLFGSQEFLQ